MTNRYDAMVAKESNGKTYWTKLGVMFENKSGKGFTLLLDAIPVPTDGAYRISLFEPKESNSSSGGSSGGNSSGGGFNRPGANRGGGQSNFEPGNEDDIPF